MIPHQVLPQILSIEFYEAMNLLVLTVIDKTVRVFKIDGVKNDLLMMNECQIANANERGPNSCFRAPFIVK